ncbi:MAG: hypothetical protein CVU17_01645 [Betaproteobacteria bacterium HGW-Betaproteobacteria-11]|nr:MAG: hypothetical protein CVU17_01645 [Betaproteobacteria bacterium HGW-Betaproteobacteria-11]
MTLIITMVMLVILTLFAVSAIRISGINLRIAANYQWQKEMEALTDSAIEQLVTTSTTFDNAAIQAGTAVDQVVCADGVVGAAGSCTVGNPQIGTVTVPRCLSSNVAPGYSKKLEAMSPDDNEWLIKSTATDSFSGAKVTIYRGVTVRMLANNCPE